NVLQIKSKLRGLETDDITNTVGGTAWIHHAWSGDVYQVISQVDDPSTITYQTCKEGVPTGNDTMMILKNAQHPGTAMKFIDWMLDPANATANVDWFGYPQVTNTGLQHFNQTIGKDYPFLQVSLDQAISGLREIVPTGQNLQLWLSEWRKRVYLKEGAGKGCGPSPRNPIPGAARHDWQAPGCFALFVGRGELGLGATRVLR